MDNDVDLMIRLYEKMEKELTRKIGFLKQMRKRTMENRELLQTFFTDLSDDEDITLKEIPGEICVFTSHTGILDFEAYRVMLTELEALIQDHKLKAKTTISSIYTGFFHKGGPVFLFRPLESSARDLPCIREYGSFTAAVSIHKGSLLSIADRIEKMQAWLKQNGCHPTGDVVTKYLIGTNITFDENKFITEIRIPVRDLQEPKVSCVDIPRLFKN